MPPTPAKPLPRPLHVVVLGGGISGLTTAFYVSRLRRAPPYPPKVQVTVLEKSHRVGGWIKSMPLGDGMGRVALEAGPRTVKSGSGSEGVLQLVKDLDLQSKLIVAPKSSPAGRNRYIYMDGKLTLMPTGLWDVFLWRRKEFWWMVKAVFGEARKPANRPDFSQTHDDESVDALLRRRFDDPRVAKLGSAVLHGIYAADSDALSVKAVMPNVAHAEKRGKGSLVLGMLNPPDEELVEAKEKLKIEMRAAMKAKGKNPATGRLGPGRRDDVATILLGEDLMKVLDQGAAFTFEGGMETLPRTLKAKLEESENVNLRIGGSSANVKVMEKDDGGAGFKLTLEDGSTIMASHVVSTIPFPALHSILSSSSKPPLDQLLYSPETTVQVLNLVFPPSRKPIPYPPGFGVLMARPEEGYPKEVVTTVGDKRILQNVLGIVFDSEIDPEHDPVTQPTVMTMMMGGPFPLYQPQSQPSAQGTSTSTTLSEDELQIFLDTIQHYLGIKHLPEPMINAFHTHYNCIPSPKPGAPMVYREIARAIEKEWGPNLKVIGSLGGSVGIGLRAAVNKGREVALT